MADAPAHHLLVLLGAQFYVAETRFFFGYGSSRIELPAIKAATNRCGFGTSGSSWSLGCYSAAWQLQGFWTESVLNKDATWLPSSYASVDIHTASRLSRDWSSCKHCIWQSFKKTIHLSFLVETRRVNSRPRVENSAAHEKHCKINHTNTIPWHFPSVGICHQTSDKDLCRGRSLTRYSQGVDWRAGGIVDWGIAIFMQF